MMKTPLRFLPLLVIVPVLFSCGGTTTIQIVQKPTPEPPLPRGKVYATVKADGVTRNFVLHVPDAVDRSKKVPLVFVVHGTDGTGDTFYDVSGWVQKSDTEHFIVIFPTAISYCHGTDGNLDGQIEPDEFFVATKWAAGQLGTSVMPLCTDDQIAQLSPADQAKVESRTVHDDVAFFDAMITAAEAALPIDSKRIYVAGFSNGAEMTGRLLMERAKTFAAFALSSGFPVVPGPAERPAPVAFSVGNVDEKFLYFFRVGYLPLDTSFFQITRLRDMIDDIATSVGLDPNNYAFASSSVAGETVATFTFDASTSSAGNELMVDVIQDASHEYPNGQNHPISMADLLWPFFSRYSLP